MDAVLTWDTTAPAAVVRSTETSKLERRSLTALYAFTLTAVAGYAAFGVDPSRLDGLPQWALSFYGRSFGFFALGHVWLAMAVLATVLTVRAGGQWLTAFAALYVVSLSSELAGTTWGVPFGEYSYSTMLAPMWLDRVPVIIPMSWFFMALPSYALSSLVVERRALRIAVASLMLLAWDLALDPAMSYATPYWQWGESGPYYGMPWLNLFGWYVTGVVLMLLLSVFKAEQWTARVSPRWWVGYYGANLVLPLGMCAAAGLWGAVLATTLLLGLMFAALVGVPQRREARSR